MRFDLTRQFSLFEAFDRTGRRIFGNAWQGTEALARRVEDPEASRKERQVILTQIAELSAESVPHQTILSIEAGDEAHQEAAEALHHINRKLDSLKRELNALPHVTDFWVQDHAAFTRRMRVEEELRGAFEQGELFLVVGPSTVVDWKNWVRAKDFKVYYGLSMVRCPKDLCARRRGPAFIEKASFLSWLDRFEPPSDDDENARLNPNAVLKAWLEARIKEQPTKEWSKAEYRQRALSEIKGVTARGFNRVWDNTVPESWKSAGRLKR